MALASSSNRSVDHCKGGNHEHDESRGVSRDQRSAPRRGGRPRPKAGEAVIRITATTICGTDVHIVKGEYPVRSGLILGHEPVGVIEELGEGLEDEYAVGQRVIVGAITPCGQCFYCLNGGALAVSRRARRLAVRQHDQRRLGRVSARAGRPRQPGAVPDELTDEQVLMLPDIASTGISGAESGERPRSAIGGGVCTRPDRAVRDARRQAARRVADHRRRPVSERREMSRRFGASLTLIPPAPMMWSREIKGSTGGRGVDVAIEALGRQETFESALRSIRPGGVLSSLGVYSGKLVAPTRRFTQGWPISASSRRSAPVARNGCGGSWRWCPNTASI